jgi:quinol monooxygenase YgiN
MKTTIEKGAPVVTLINVFTVDPSKQDELVKVLDNATEKVVKNLTGFVSANIHRSFDGRHVANYAQWESREALDAMLAHPAAQQHPSPSGRPSQAQRHEKLFSLLPRISNASILE